MKTSLHPCPLSLIAAAAALAIAGCGGGGGGDDDPEPGMVHVTTAVLDGPIEGANVCLDKNDNGACDDGEPAAVSGDDGQATLSVPEADAGQYPLIAVVGTDAVDQVHGPVTLPFVLRTPADQTDVISPLTTLVKAQADSTGIGTAAAEQLLREQLGLEASLFSDYADDSVAQADTLANLAHVLALIQQQVADDVKEAEGETDTSGGTISAEDLARAVDAQMLRHLPAVATALASDAVREAETDAALEAALQAAAASLVADEMAFDAATAVGAAKSYAAATPAIGASPPKAGASLRWFTYADAGNWYFRAFASTLEQDTPDADGVRRFTEARKRAIEGRVEVWGESPDYTQNNLYWTGTEWFACPTDLEHRVTSYDDDGVAESTYCHTYVSTNRRSDVDVAGQSLSDVVRTVRAFHLPDGEGDYTQWGPEPDHPALAGKVLPAGAKLSYYTRTDVSTPEAYNGASTNIVKTYTAEVANGTDAACARRNFSADQFAPATLEAMAAASPGKPCVYTPGTDEWWYMTTVSIGTVPGPLPAPDGYSSNRSIRAAFGADDSVTYYNCAVSSGGGARNCVVAGSGSYRIETRGDGRVMRFNGVPVDAAPLNYERVFVERAGAVYYGFKSKLRSDHSVRLNAEAADTLLGALGLSR